MISIEPMMSLSTFLIGSILFLIVGRVLVDYTEYLNGKSSSNRGNDQTSKRYVSASQKAIQRYYNRKSA